MATTKTVGTDKDYSTLQGWEDWADGQASAAQWAEVYGPDDVGPCIVAGWTGTPDADNYPRIYVPYAERGDGTTTYSSGAYCITTAANSGTAVWVQENYTRIEGLIAYSARASNGVFFSYGMTEVLFDGCVVVCGATHTLPGFYLYRKAAGTVNVYLSNCIAYGCGIVGAFCYGIYGECNQGVLNVVIENCSTDGWDDGGICATQNTGSPNTGQTNATITGCISGNNTGGDYVRGHVSTSMTVTYCLSEDATADDWGGAGNVAGATWANTITTAGSNLALKNILSPAVDASVDPGFTNDALNDTGRRPKRDGYDMGALELGEDALYTRVQVVVRNVAYDSAKVLTEANITTLCGTINDALDAVSDLTFSHIEMQCRRDDDTPGS